MPQAITRGVTAALVRATRAIEVATIGLRLFDHRADRANLAKLDTKPPCRMCP